MFTSATDLRRVDNPDLPETKTFNATPSGMAYAMSGRATARVCRGLQLTAYALAVLAAAFTLIIVASVAADAVTLLMVGAVAILCVMLSAFLPSVAAHLQSADAKGARVAWLAVIMVYAFASVWLVLQPQRSAGILAFGSAAPEKAGQVMALAANAALLLAGLANRWGLLASYSAHRLWEGIGEPLPPAPVSITLPDLSDLPAGMSPEQLFKSWFLSNIRLQRDAEVRSAEALESYRTMCAKLGYPPLSDTGFYKLLAAEAAATGGKVISGKSSGMLWKGWVLEPFKVSEIAGASPLPDRPE